MTLKKLITVSAILLFVFLVARMPLGLAVDSRLPNGAVASGTIWQGAIDGVSVPGTPSARIDVSGHPHSLFALTYRADWSLNTLLVAANGEAQKGLFGDAKVLNANARMDVSALKLPLPLFGQITADIELLEFDALGRCISASGTWQTDALARSGPNFGWNGPQMAGPISCDNGILTMALSGTQDGTEVTLGLTVAAGATGTANIQVKSPPAALNFALIEAGFDFDGTGALAWSSTFDARGLNQ